MRLDRLVTLGVIHPSRRALGLGSTAPGLPVLMYHSVSDDPEKGISDYFKVCTSPHRFNEHMEWLAKEGWRGVTVTEGIATLSNSRNINDCQPIAKDADHRPHIQSAPTPLPPSTTSSLNSIASVMPKVLAITFDDGFRDFYTTAVPILQRYGFSATMYLATNFVSDQRRTFKTRECLTWDEVRELHKVGFEFGSHTVNHPRLVQLSWAEIQTELLNSKMDIECQIGSSVYSFAYPYGFPWTERSYVTQLKRLLRSAGYLTCATTEIGLVLPTDDPLQIKRLPVNTADDFALLHAKIAGSYDWMRQAQTLVKHIKGFRPNSARFRLHNTKAG